MFEVPFADISVGVRIDGDYASGTVTEVSDKGITVHWHTEDVVETYTEAEFNEYGFTAYV